MEGILSNFYQAIDPQESFFCRGAVVWAPSAFLTEEFWEVKFSQTNPAIDFGKGWITLEKRTPADCHNPASRIFRHDPVHPVHLRATEAYAALRHKLRLTIIVSVGVQYGGLGDRALRNVRRRFPDCYICAPIYTLRSDAEPDKYPALFIERIKAYAFPMTFYLGAEGTYREACVRFDRMQAIAHAFLKPEKMRLSDECQKVFDDWLKNYIFGELPSDSEIVEYKRLLAEKGI
jgi:hypothetical protein